MKLFDFVKISFSKKEDYEKLKAYEKSKHFFMFNRFMSIKWPNNANLFNHFKIQPDRVLDYWRSKTKQAGSTPKWIYTSTKSKKKDKGVKTPNEETIKEYLALKNIARKDFESAVSMFGEKTYEPIFKYQKMKDSLK